MNYEDIINLKHHVSTKHTPMSMESRAAQFAPYAALTGHGDAIKEEARLTNKKIDISEEIKMEISRNIQIINNNIKDHPEIEVTYFIKDARKEGGVYTTITDKIKRIEDTYKVIYLFNYQLNIDNIIDIKML